MVGSIITTLTELHTHLASSRETVESKCRIIPNRYTSTYIQIQPTGDIIKNRSVHIVLGDTDSVHIVQSGPHALRGTSLEQHGGCDARHSEHEPSAQPLAAAGCLVGAWRHVYFEHLAQHGHFLVLHIGVKTKIRRKTESRHTVYGGYLRFMMSVSTLQTMSDKDGLRYETRHTISGYPASTGSA